MVANYATSPMCTALAGVPVFVEAGAKRDSVTDATLISQWAANFTTTAPVAGVGNITGVLAGYLAAYPNGPQVS